MRNGNDATRIPGALTSTKLAKWDAAFAADPTAKLAMNAVTRTSIEEVALDRDRLLGVQLSMSNRLDDWKAADQKKSGRCWLFAALNLLRTDARKKLKLKDFEFSQNHAMYWDKIERANYFLEDMIGLADREPNDRTVSFLLASVADDGGQWDMEVSIFQKHGVVPKELMPETESSSCTAAMNTSLRTLLRKGARLLREAVDDGASDAEISALKDSILQDTHRVLTIHLGVPPRSFEWQWNDDDREFHSGGTFTPQSFLASFTDINLGDYVCLVDDPRVEHPKGRTLTVAHLGNVVGGQPVRYLNTDTGTMKRLAAASIVAGEPVWFGCDVDPQMEAKQGIWSADLINYSATYGVDLATTKEDRVRYGDSAMTHAMLFTGVDLVGGSARRWRVENSWGSEKFDKGFCTMDDSWFDEYVFEVVVHKDSLPADLAAALHEDPIVLDPWDPMGALA
ncbi:aminopeptidase C [Leucobacter sp. 1207-22]|uniref:aminopeptidase C n=1 Tax=Leucobacter sp. 1207-22 TaxID=2604456 RepID=UPI004063AB09